MALGLALGLFLCSIKETNPEVKKMLKKININ
jgi:ribosomal protein L30/L7E